MDVAIGVTADDEGVPAADRNDGRRVANPSAQQAAVVHIPLLDHVIPARRYHDALPAGGGTGI